MLTARQRWQHFFLRLNQIEARADDPERAAMARFILARVAEDVAPYIVLRPRDQTQGETGPACLRCEGELKRRQLLVACTVCLHVAHHECWRRAAGCPTLACVSERSDPLPAQRRTG